MYIKTIKKDYGKSVKILKYDRGVDIDPPRCQEHDQIACQLCWTRSVNPVPSPSSLMRSKTRITDYTLANDFDLFTTFTFDPSKVDSLNVSLAKKKMSIWLNNQRRDSPDMKYLIVAELHKSGRIHFHALMKHYNGKLVDSKRSKNGRIIFNISGWHYGFSTAVQIDNIAKVSTYMQKYITKEMLKIGNKKRYWGSRNLIKPIIDYNINMIEEVYSRPLFLQNEYKTDYFTIYKLIK